MHGTAPVEARIALVRHGRSAHVHTGWIAADGFRAWREAYEAAGIREDERAPEEIVQLARRADVVLASDAPRAVASARMLSPEREVVLSPLLRELDLEAPSFGGLRLPLAAWAVAVGGRALVLTLRRRYPSPAESARLDAAAALLGELAARHPLVVAVTHASVRAQLCARLACSGWVGEPGRRTRRNWSAWLLTQGGGGLARIEERSP